MAYTIPGNITWKNVSSGTVLLNLDSGEYYTLNDTGSLIWAGIMESKESTNIVANIVAEFECDESTAESDYNEYIQYLLNEKLLSENK